MKIFKYVLVLLIIIVGYLVFILKPDNTLSIVSVKHNFSQNIKDNEVVRIPLLVSLDDSYVTDSSQIESITLKNSDNRIPVNLDEISKQEYTINYNNSDYYAYMIDILLNQDNLKITLSDASLEIKYINSKIIEFNIGDIDTISDSVKDFDITMLDSKSDTINGYYTVTEAIVGVRPRNDLIIKNVSINSENYFIDNKNIIVEEELKDHDTKNNKITDESSNDEISITLSKDQNYYLRIPINYLNTEYLFRFYLDIKTDLNDNYIDDFLYLNQGYFPSFIFDTAEVQYL